MESHELVIEKKTIIGYEGEAEIKTRFDGNLKLVEQTVQSGGSLLGKVLRKIAGNNSKIAFNDIDCLVIYRAREKQSARHGMDLYRLSLFTTLKEYIVDEVKADYPVKLRGVAEKVAKMVGRPLYLTLQRKVLNVRSVKNEAIGREPDELDLPFYELVYRHKNLQQAQYKKGCKIEITENDDGIKICFKTPKILSEGLDFRLYLKFGLPVTVVITFLIMLYELIINGISLSDLIQLPIAAMATSNIVCFAIYFVLFSLFGYNSAELHIGLQTTRYREERASGEPYETTMKTCDIEEVLSEKNDSVPFFYYYKVHFVTESRNKNGKSSQLLAISDMFQNQRILYENIELAFFRLRDRINSLRQ
ncbi:MAG: hypothetical protein PHD82_07235 [Candidatus Riflebacteria bacterium]|nr:hypothetical protein [Candidatus Riflebacteria bacterium]